LTKLIGLVGSRAIESETFAAEEDEEKGYSIKEWGTVEEDIKGLFESDDEHKKVAAL